jgi:hypothetical protein
MGDSIEHWRAKIGQWSGGRLRQCVTSQHLTAQTSNHIGYKYIRFLVLVSLLAIGCVELNPGSYNVRYVIHSNIHLYMCKGFVGKIVQGRWKEKRQIIVYFKIIMVI